MEETQTRKQEYCSIPGDDTDLSGWSGMVISLVLALVFLAMAPVRAQKKWQKEPCHAEPVVCYASEESGHSYVNPPEEFLNRLKGGKKSCNIKILYVNTPDSVKPAIEFATNVWEYLLSSSIPIYLKVSWQPLGSTTLGNCGASNYYVNFEGAPMKDTYYPVAVVEKILGKELTGSGNPDMVAKFNSNISWYLGTDGNTPSTKYDLVSTVMHEIGHGLGFVGFFQANTTQKTASYGYGNNLPSAYDRYLESYNQQRLTDPAFFTNPSNDLYKAVVSNQLYSGSPVAYVWGLENRPRLYAPVTFNAGSSIYHLNDANYPYGDINALMTSSAGKGEAIHTPGPLTSGILADLGWKHLYFGFTPVNDREENTQPLDFNLSINSDLGLKKGSLYFIYSYDEFGLHSDSVSLVPSATPGNYTARINPRFSKGTITYYFTASDSLGRKFTAPYNVPDSLFSLRMGPDTIKPVISHHPVKYILSSIPEFEVAATATDNLGIDSVAITFYQNGEPLVTKGLVKGDGNEYRGTFNFHELGIDNSDSVRYSIVATDAAKAKNQTRLPLTGHFAFKIEKINYPVKEFATNFDTLRSDFVLTDFAVSQVSGFDSPALNSPHPYPSPDKENDSLQFVTVLRWPVILEKNGSMSFDEVVLVEPAEDGAVFGSSEFWDYVVVEGSRDQGKNWLPLVDGYDSGSQSAWVTAWNSKISGNNSTAAGTKDLFFRRNINLTGNGNFREGDTILVRFRLYSDPFSHGWGWAVDNLYIQTKTTSNRIFELSNRQITMWPNPVQNQLNLFVDKDESIRRMDIEIIDLTGRTLLAESRTGLFPGEKITLHLGSIPRGLFVIKIKIDKKVVYTQKIIKAAF